ncbi:hypothetical protein C2E23DRAFT_147926 [Lenzites betulinus]|nr:hypothetical protein C2E23DRAFT_147926 [Lenzites betulinus]
MPIMPTMPTLTPLTRRRRPRPLRRLPPHPRAARRVYRLCSPAHSPLRARRAVRRLSPHRLPHPHPAARAPKIPRASPPRLTADTPERKRRRLGYACAHPAPFCVSPVSYPHYCSSPRAPSIYDGPQNPGPPIYHLLYYIEFRPTALGCSGRYCHCRRCCLFIAAPSPPSRGGARAHKLYHIPQISSSTYTCRIVVLPPSHAHMRLPHCSIGIGPPLPQNRRAQIGRLYERHHTHIYCTAWSRHVSWHTYTDAYTARGRALLRSGWGDTAGLGRTW